MYVEAKNLFSQLKLENRLLKRKLHSLQNEKTDIYEFTFQTHPQSINVSRLSDGLFILVNDAFSDLTGYSRKEVIGKTSNEINIWYNPKDRIEYVKKLKKHTQIDDFETKIRYKNGSIRLVSLSARIFKYHGEDCILTIGRDIHDQRLTELAYQKNRNHYQALFEDSRSIMLLIDPDTGAIVNANNAACRYYGYSHQEITRMKISDINLLPKEQIKQEMKLARTSKKNHFFFKHRLSSNEIRDVEVYSGQIMFEGRELLYSIIHDITNRIKAEEILKNREAILQTVIRNIPFDMWARDLNGVYFLQNESSIKSWGNSLGLTIDEQNVPEETKEIWKSNNKRAYKGETVNEEIRYINSNGSESYFQNIITPIIEDKKIIGILGFNFDISERKKSEKELLKALANMEAMINNTDDYILIADKEGRTIFYNQSLAAVVKKVLGIDLQGGMKAFEYLKDKNQIEFWENNQKRVLSGEKFKDEFYIEVDGIERCFELSFYPVIENNEVIGFAEHSRDITERKQYEKKLKDAKQKAEESDRLKSAFLSNISHEIRTPMNGIVGFAEMLKDCELKEDKRKFFTNAILVSSQQLLKIVNNILDISKIETGQVEIINEPVIINKMIRELFNHYKPIAEKKKLEFEFDLYLTDRRSIFNLDRNKLYQVLDNLLENSIKFTTSGYIRFGYDFDHDKLRFYVEDTGMGIAPEYKDKIFLRFFKEESQISYHYRGTGLGLSISKAYIEAMGGTIMLESTSGKGSKFQFTIPMDPVTDKEFDRSQMITKKEKLFDRPVTILIAEDEEMNYTYMKTVLSDENITLLHATDGQMAIDLCQKHPEIDLILMDIKMPVIDGYEATRRIRDFRPNLPIIAQTAYVITEDKNKARQAGCNDYLVKPINYIILKERISKLL